jgi:hypothetical protein
MKTLKITLCLAMTMLLSDAYGQMPVFIKVRPRIFRYLHIETANPHYEWINEDLEPMGSHYVFIGGHWSTPPYEGMVWISPHWKLKHSGRIWGWTWEWVPGHWQ